MQYKFDIGDVVRVIKLYDDDLEGYGVNLNDIGVVSARRMSEMNQEPHQKILYLLKWFASGDPYREMFEYQMEKVDAE